MLSSEENVIKSVPHIKQAMIDLELPIETDGELYKHGWNINQIHSAVSRGEKNLHPDYEQIEYHIFDYVSKEPQIDRTSNLIDLKESLSGPIKLVPSFIVNDYEDLMRHYKMFREMQYEGIIVRSLHHPYMRQEKCYRSPFMLKFKPKKKDIYKITSVIEAVSKKDNARLHMVGAFECSDPEGNVFEVGAGNLTHKERRELWGIRGILPGCDLLVQYQHLTPRGVPRSGFCVRVLG
jgi:hypothetical protein